MKFYMYSTTAKQKYYIDQSATVEPDSEQTYLRHQYGIFGLNRRFDERGETAVSIRCVTHS